MRLNDLCGAALVLLSLASISCHPEQGEPGSESEPLTSTESRLEARAMGPLKVLILGSSVAGGSASREALAATHLGFDVDLVTPEQWRRLRTRDFMQYAAIVLGEAGCETNQDAIQAAILNRHVWGHIIDGAVVIIGGDPVTNNTPRLVENGIEFAATNHAGTGLYVSLGCAYKDAPAGTVVKLLEPIGTFKVAGVDCAPRGHRFVTSPETLSVGLSDANVVGAGCAARAVFTEYPERNFAIGMLGMAPGRPVPNEQLYRDFVDRANFVGAPSLLMRGAMAVSGGCGGDGVPSGEECDLGDFENGRRAMPGDPPELTCSWACKLNWCGDGVVDEVFGEQCDLGVDNGRDWEGNQTACSATCKIPPLPPKALCTDVTLAAALDACGAPANINNGSSDPDGDLVGCVQEPAGPYALGETMVTLRCTDASDNFDTCTGKVTVLDQAPPVVALASPEPVTVECRSRYEEPAVTASDFCEGDLTDAIVKTGAVDPDVPGTYRLRYGVTDSAGNSAETAERTVTVADRLAPTLTLSAAPPAVLECATPFTEPTATATDLCSGELTAAIRKEGAVNPNVPGAYALKWSVTDQAGLTTTKNHPVNVRDTIPPVVTVLGPLSQNFECGSGPYADPGARASDTCAGTLPAKPTSPVNPKAPGSYPVTYFAQDPSGNVGTAAAIRTVTVSDTQPPVLTLRGPATQRVECGSDYTESGATAFDMCAGDLTGSIVKTGTVDPAVPGRYALSYRVSDPGSRTATQVRQVNVTDTLPPVITVLGPPEASIRCGETYVDPGATAMDVCAGALTVRATRVGVEGRPGRFGIRYTAQDPSGNVATAAAVRVVDVEDDAPPVLVLRGPSALGVECGMPYEDLGAAASDACFGDLTGAIRKSGSVDPKVLGRYTLSYEVTDPAGRSASPVAREVSVRDTLPPELTLNGPARQQVECGSGRHTDPGFSATDVCTGDLTSAVRVTGEVDLRQLGTQMLSYDVADVSGNRAPTTRRAVEVIDTLAPRIECPEPIEAQAATEENLATVTLGTATASDECDSAVKVSSPTETVFAVGTTNLTYTATDASGNTASCTTQVTVLEFTPPDEPRIDWDRAVLGSGNGCATTSGGPSSLALLALMGLASMLARKLRRR
jgi:hypothetical protein